MKRKDLITEAQELLSTIPNVGFHGFLNNHIVYWAEIAGEVTTHPVSFDELPSFIIALQRAQPK